MTMIVRISVGAVAVLLGMVLLIQRGCTTRSKTASFYLLSPESETTLAMKTISGGSSDVSICISPVSLPKYLRKSQIVTRTGSNELHLAEFDRWAGKIEEDIGRVIAENLSNLLATDKVFMHPLMDGIMPDYNFKIDISRFDGELGGEVALIVRWAIFDSKGNIVYGLKATHLIEPVKGPGYPDMVEAQSLVLASFSRQLSEAIIELSGS
jgi:uncharacterized lipoprotein YmbA